MKRESNTMKMIVMRAAMMLLLAVLTTATTWAELTTEVTTIPDGNVGGTATVDGPTVTITVYDGYCLKKLMWDNGTSTLTIPSISDDAVKIITLPQAEGIVYVTFAQKTDDVRVRFNTKGVGTSPATQDLKLGDKVTRPTPDPTDEYNDFINWYRGSRTKPYDFNTVLSSDDLTYSPDIDAYSLTLNAKWKQNWNVQIKFNLNEHGGDYFPDQYRILGEKAIVPVPAPTDPAYTFVGWYKDKKGTQPYDFDTTLDAGSLTYNETTKTYSMTLYAKWEASVTWAVSKSAGSDVEDVLTISGTGAMLDYSSYKTCPWYSYRNQIKTIIIGEGVTHIGARAFQHLENVTSDITIPASVTSIGEYAFDYLSKKVSGIHIATATGSQLAEIGGSAFRNTNASIDLSQSDKLATIKKNVFYKTTKNVTLPSSVTTIIKGAISSFLGDHVYIPIPEHKILTVNGTDFYESDNLLPYRRADLKSYKKKVITLAITDFRTYNITTDGIVETYYNEGAVQITKARAGETVTLSWGGWALPKGTYVSGFTVTKAGGGTVEAKPNEDNTDYTFIMPAEDVTVSTLLALQEEYRLDLTQETQVVIPETLLMLMNTTLGYGNYDETLGNFCIDVNRDGKPDLELTQPAAEEEEDETPSGDEEEEETDPFADKYTVKRLAGADDVTTNYHLTFVYPQAYRYNKVLIVLGTGYPEEEQPVLEPLDDGFDNSSTLAEWAGDGKTHNVIILERTLWRDGNWNTLSLPFDVTIAGSALDFDGVEARPLSSASISGTTLTLNFGSSVTTLEAGVPYIIKWTAAAQNIVKPAFLGVSIPSMGTIDPEADPEPVVKAFFASKGYDTNVSGVTTDERVRFLGTYGSTTFTDEDKSILFLGASNTLYYPQPALTDPSQPWSETNPWKNPTIGAFRAYFKIGDDATAARALTDFNMNFSDGAECGDAISDGSEGTGICPAATKEIADRTGAWYDLSGRKLQVEPTQKGIYVKNGRKFIVK